MLEKCRLEIVIIVGEEATSSDLSVRRCLKGFETNVVKVLVNYFGDTRRIVKLNLYWGQADGYQILFCVIFPLSGAAPNATCVSIIPGKRFFSRADTSACV